MTQPTITLTATVTHDNHTYTLKADHITPDTLTPISAVFLDYFRDHLPPTEVTQLAPQHLDIFHAATITK